MSLILFAIGRLQNFFIHLLFAEQYQNTNCMNNGNQSSNSQFSTMNDIQLQTIDSDNYNFNNGFIHNPYNSGSIRDINEINPISLTNQMNQINKSNQSQENKHQTHM